MPIVQDGWGVTWTGDPIKKYIVVDNNGNRLPQRSSNGGGGAVKTSSSSSKSSSETTSSSYTGLDRAAKSLADSQFDAAIARINRLSGNIDSQYGQRLGSMSSFFDSIINDQKNVGEAPRSKIYRDFGNMERSVGQPLMNRGLYNTTLVDTAKQLVGRERASALGSLEETLRKSLQDINVQKATSLDNISSQRLGSLANIGVGKAQLEGQKAGTLPTSSKSSSVTKSTNSQSSLSSG